MSVCKYSNKKGCRCLSVQVCKKKCSFFQTKDQYDESVYKASERLKSLPLPYQQELADKYNGGVMEWHYTDV